MSKSKKKSIIAKAVDAVKEVVSPTEVEEVEDVAVEIATELLEDENTTLEDAVAEDAVAVNEAAAGLVDADMLTSVDDAKEIAKAAKRARR